MIEKLVEFSTNRPRGVILAAVLISLALAARFPRTETISLTLKQAPSMAGHWALLND